MMSRRLKLAVLAQVVATAALVTPTMGHWMPGQCTAQQQRVCDTQCEKINWGDGTWTGIVDGYYCSGSQGHIWADAWSDDADAETIDAVCNDLMAECEDWTGGGSR